MLGTGRGRQERGHLASSYSSGSGRLDTGIVPKALPCSLDYKFGLRQMTLYSYHFQHLHSEDSREKPRSETLTIHVGSEYGSS